MQEQETVEDEDGRALLEAWRRDPEAFQARVRERLDARMAEVTEQADRKLRVLSFKERMVERQRVRQADSTDPVRTSDEGRHQA